MPRQAGELPKKNEAGKWAWADGTEASPEELQAIMGAAEGKTPEQGGGDTGVTGTTYLPGSSDMRLDASAPGAELDTGLMDQDRARMGGLLQQLQQQAATGDGAWEATFRDATAKSGAAAQALGQSTPGASYQSQLRSIGDAQGAVAQKAVGQENILRAQAQQDAQTKLSDAYANQGAMDVDQSKNVAQARQDVRTVNDAQDKNNDKNNGNFVAAVGQTFANAVGLSDGGPVPGQPKVFGNDEKNDTVPAMLSPGEVVLPRTISGDPAAAADFVRSLNAQRGGGVQHFADGGQAAPWKPGDMDPTSQVKDESGVIRDKAPENPLPWITQKFQAPSVENGGVLDSGNYMNSRAGNLANDQAFLAQTQGKGPSVAGQQAQDSSDAAIASAMQTQVAGRNKGPAGASVMQGAQQAQMGAGQAGEQMGREASGAQGDLARSILRQRQIDSTFAQNQQVAAFRNTMANAGISLEQMAQMKGLISAGGQAVTSLASMGENMPERDTYEGEFQADEEGDRGGVTDLSADDPEFKAHGGVVGEDMERRKARDFLASLRGEC